MRLGYTVVASVFMLACVVNSHALTREGWMLGFDLVEHCERAKSCVDSEYQGLAASEVEFRLCLDAFRHDADSSIAQDVFYNDCLGFSDGCAYMRCMSMHDAASTLQ